MNKEKRVIVPASLTFEEHCRVNGIQKDKVLGYWHKSKYYSLKVDNKPKTEDIELIKNNLIKDLNKYSPKYNRFKYIVITFFCLIFCKINFTFCSNIFHNFLFYHKYKE